MPRIQTHPQRVGIFIDVQNVYHSAKNLRNARVNFEKLVKEVTKDRLLIRCLAYVVKSETATGEHEFFEALKKSGIELRMKDLQTFHSGAKKADWDVGMAVDAIRISHMLDVIVLVTGDGDFIPLVEYLKLGLGKQVEVAAFEKTTSSKLIEVADDFTDIASSSARLLMKIPGRTQQKTSTRKSSNKK